LADSRYLHQFSITSRHSGGSLIGRRAVVAGGRGSPHTLRKVVGMAREKILVVDDEVKIVHVVRAYLEKEGYQVVAAYDGQQALDAARREHPDLIILDLMLPEMSGWDVCRSLRQESDVPVIMLTAQDEDTDKIVGLKLGADDYVTKPFNPKELMARVQAVLRRAGREAPKTRLLKAGGLRIDVDRREVRIDEREVHLTPTEFDLLVALAEHPGRVLSREQLLDRVAGGYLEGYDRAIDSHIKNLRQKIEPDPRRPRYVLTAFGVGYKFAGG
jgi:DNA-binding response OmpR family regulator